MGLNPSFPIPVPKTHISFEPAKTYSSSGKRNNIVQDYDKTPFESATEKNFECFIEQRKKAKRAREVLGDIETLKKKFPNYTATQLEDMKFQFRAFDLNQDGLIDFREMERALDQLGDISSHEERRRTFDLMDRDHSDAVDFQEFLELLTAVANKEKTISVALGTMCMQGTEMSNYVRHMSVDEQLKLHLF